MCVPPPPPPPQSKAGCLWAFTCPCCCFLPDSCVRSPRLISGCRSCGWCASSPPSPCSPSSAPDDPELPHLLWNITQKHNQTVKSFNSSKCCRTAAVDTMSGNNLPLPPPCMGWRVALWLDRYGWPFCVRPWKAKMLLFMPTASTFMTHREREEIRAGFVFLSLEHVKFLSMLNVMEAASVAYRAQTLTSNQRQTSHKNQHLPSHSRRNPE